MSFNMKPVAVKLAKGNGDMAEMQIAGFETDGEVILTALYYENGATLARLCNFSDSEVKVVLSPSFGKITAQVDLLGNETDSVKNNTLSFGAWEIKTVKIK